MAEGCFHKAIIMSLFGIVEGYFHKVIMMSLFGILDGYFHKAIMMSGSDLSSWAVMNNTQAPKEYTRDLSKIVGCGGGEVDDGMIRCLRTRSPPDLVNAAEKVSLRVSGFSKHTSGHEG